MTDLTAQHGAPNDNVDDKAPIKLVNREFLRNPYPILTALRQEGPAFPMEGNGFRMWVVTRYADVRRILKDTSINKDVAGTRKERVTQSLVRAERRARVPVKSRRSMLDRDGEDHRRLRGIIQHLFQPQRMLALQPRVRELANSLVADLPSTGLVDLHAQFALPLARTIVSELTGVPEQFRELFPPLVSGILTGSSVEAVEDAGREMHELALELIDHIRSHPGDNLFTLLVAAHEEGKMDEDELASMFIVLLLGGLEPATAICNGLLLLLRHPEQKARLIADPGLIHSCVEETLRFESPFRMLPPRFSDKPIELDGVTIPAKEMVIFCIASANRDPDIIDDGDRFDIGRQNIPHISFGHGAHRCLGAELGRIEAGEGIAAILRRFPNLQLAVEPDQIRWRPTTFLRRVDSLPISLDFEASGKDNSQTAAAFFPHDPLAVDPSTVA